MKSILSWLLLLLTITTFSQVKTNWEQILGGPNSDGFRIVRPTQEGGFIAAGTTNSVCMGFCPHRYWIVKFDSNGQEIWSKSYGGYNANEYLASLEPIDSGGYIVGGTASSCENNVGCESDISESLGGTDSWIFKIDENGNILWDRSYGGFYDDDTELIKPINSNEFILVFQENGDLRVVKLDENGEVIWTQNYGNNLADSINDFVVTSDNGLLLVGSRSFSIQAPLNSNQNGWIIKTDSLGQMEWEHYIGLPETTGHEQIFNIIQNPDNTFFLGCSSTAWTSSVPGDVSNNYGGRDLWLVKIDSLANILWERNYGGSESDYFAAFYPSQDGEIILAGNVESTDFDLSDNIYEGELPGIWIMKVDSVGNIIWDHNFSYGYGNDLILDSEGNFVLTGGKNGDGFIINFKGLKRIQAKTFFDENQNGIFDTDEIPLNNQTLILDPAEIQAFTNSEGEFFFYVEEGTFTLSYQQSNPIWDLSSGPESYSIEIGEEPIDTTFYFPVAGVFDLSLQNVDLTSSITRCNNLSSFWLTYENLGTTTSDGCVKFIPDTLTTFNSSNPEPDLISGDTLIWYYENLAPTHSASINILFQMPSVDFIGTNLQFIALIDGLDGLGGDKVVYNSELVCSYDPNDKLVYPDGCGLKNYTNHEDSLQYTIRFQNTGNDTAFNIIIRDTISSFLDLTSIKLIASSHEMWTQVRQEENIIEFNFDNIQLPDSNSNEIASHGFVKFQVKANEDAIEGTDIENTAGIFFDFNPPIITNTVSNTISNLDNLAYQEPNLSISNLQCQGADYSFLLTLFGDTSSVYSLSLNSQETQSVTTDENGLYVQPFEFSGNETNLELVATAMNFPNCNVLLDIEGPNCACPIFTEVDNHQIICSGEYLTLDPDFLGFSIEEDPYSLAGDLVFTQNNVNPNFGGIFWSEVDITNNETCDPVTDTLFAWLNCSLNMDYFAAGYISTTIYPEPFNTNLIDDGSNCSNPTVELISDEGETCFTLIKETACLSSDDSFEWDFSSYLDWLNSIPLLCPLDEISGTIDCQNCECQNEVMVEAGNLAAVNATDVSILLDSMVLGASISGGGVSNGVWSTSGDGVFSGSPNFSDNPEYLPGAMDIESGMVILSLNSFTPENPDCSEATDQLIITFYEEPISGVDDINFKCNIFPNPNDGNFLVSIPNFNLDYRLSLINSNGEEVYFEHSNSSILELKLSKLNSGIFYLIVESENEYLVKKVLIF